MLFTSSVFFFGYLPIVLGGFYLLGLRHPFWAASWLFLASVVFYGYWMPEFVLLLLGSIAGNFWIGSRIGANRSGNTRLGGGTVAKRWLIFGVVSNLALLGYFKYAGFFIANINALLGQDWNLGKIVLPIGISFFTFTQIAFLADAYSKGIKEYRLVHYGLFVTYFPHLIAGPILHHAQMMPQFGEAATYRFNAANVSAGLCIFAIGLFKKIVLADGVSPYADAVFSAAEAGIQPTAVEAWIGALAYTFQLYFDFSGYSDMAIGLSWMFNVRLPFNFDSPYKARSIAEFWHRWHMTLSTFLRDYLYVPLGGNRMGEPRRYINLFATMVLGGLWHGANWTFVFWGALHGMYLAINHAFQLFSGPWLSNFRETLPYQLVAWGLTFICVVIAWVFFRATDFPSAVIVLSAMTSLSNVVDVSGLAHVVFWNQGLDTARGIYWILILGSIAFALPNSNHLGDMLVNQCRKLAAMVPLAAGVGLTTSVFLVLINSTRSSVSAFIYFNF
jgi:alginate O-acetyltransferase complex protein AlgI